MLVRLVGDENWSEVIHLSDLETLYVFDVLTIAVQIRFHIPHLGSRLCSAIPQKSETPLVVG